MALTWKPGAHVFAPTHIEIFMQSKGVLTGEVEKSTAYSWQLAPQHGGRLGAGFHQPTSTTQPRVKSTITVNLARNFGFNKTTLQIQSEILKRFRITPK